MTGRLREPKTLRSELLTALNMKASSENEPVQAEEAPKRYQVSVKLYAKTQVDLTLAEAGLLLERVGRLYGDMPLIAGRIGDVLEGTSSPPPRPNRMGASSENHLARPFLGPSWDARSTVKLCPEALRRAREKHDCTLRDVDPLHQGGMCRRRPG